MNGNNRGEISPIIQRAFEYIQEMLGPIEATLSKHVLLPTVHQPHRNGHIVLVMGHGFELDNTTAESMIEPMGYSIITDFVYGQIMPAIKTELEELIAKYKSNE